MSDVNGSAQRKPAASETGGDAAAKVLQEYKELMLEAGSPNGAWNPEPDEHILGMIRTDVSLSENEVKTIFGVKAHCLRNNPLKGRTAWGWTPTGQLFRATELSNYYGWDEANTLKWLKRPIAFGFLRKNKETGQLGIGALVRGSAPSDPKPQPDEADSAVDLLVRTDKLPRYLAEALVKLRTKEDREQFLEGWRPIKAKARQKLNAAKQRLYDDEQRRLSEYCTAFDPRLPDLKRKTKSEEADSADQPGNNLSVRTSTVQDSAGPLYKRSGASVQTTHIRKERKAVFTEAAAASTVVEDTGKKQNAPPPADSGFDSSIEDQKAEIAEALAECEPPEPGDVHDLYAKCKRRDALATGAEIAAMIRSVAPRWHGPGLALFLSVVPQKFPLARRSAAVAPAAPSPDENTGAWGIDLSRAELERELGAQNDPVLRQLIQTRLNELDSAEGRSRAQARKAGQA